MTFILITFLKYNNLNNYIIFYNGVVLIPKNYYNILYIFFKRGSEKELSH